MSAFSVSGFQDQGDAVARLATALGAPVQMMRVHRFPDGESMPVAPAPASPTIVLYRSLDRPNAKLVELLLAADAWRRAGATRLILVAPYLCYMRQDAVFHPGEPLSRDVVAPLLGAAFDAIITVEAHLHRTSDLATVTGRPCRNLSSVEPLALALPAYLSPPLVVGPDAESTPWVQTWASRLHGDAITLAKIRRGDRSVRLKSPGPLNAEGRSVLIVDDVASTGATLGKAAALMLEAGAASVDVAVAHALTSPATTRRLLSRGIRSIFSTDSVRHPTNAATLAPFLAQAVREIGNQA